MRIFSIIKTRWENFFSVKKEKNAEISSVTSAQQYSVQWQCRKSIKQCLKTARVMRFSKSSATVSEAVRRWLTAQNSVDEMRLYHALRWWQQLQQIKFRSVKMQHKSLQKLINHCWSINSILTEKCANVIHNVYNKSKTTTSA